MTQTQISNICGKNKAITLLLEASLNFSIGYDCSVNLIFQMVII